MSEWQPIETAPRDGTEIDLWASGRRWADCHWHLGEWLRWQSDSVDEEPTHKRIAFPTHWMPLPPAPGGDAGEAELSISRFTVADLRPGTPS
jgi:hypothetical protein